MFQGRRYLRVILGVVVVVCTAFVLPLMVMRISSKSSLQLEAIESQPQLAEAMQAKHCVIVTEMGWSAQSMLKSHLVAVLRKERRQAGRRDIASFAMELSDPKPAFVVEWLHAHPEISPHANQGFGEVVCIADGKPVKVIREFRSIAELDNELCSALSLD